MTVVMILTAILSFSNLITAVMIMFELTDLEEDVNNLLTISKDYGNPE